MFFGVGFNNGSSSSSSSTSDEDFSSNLTGITFLEEVFLTVSFLDLGIIDSSSSDDLPEEYLFLYSSF